MDWDRSGTARDTEHVTIMVKIGDKEFVVKDEDLKHAIKAQGK